MANHPAADPVDVAIVMSACGEIARAVRYHEERLSILKYRRAATFLAGAERLVTIAAMAEACGVSEGLVRAELIRARKMAAISS